MEHEELLKILEDLHNSTNDNIVGIGWGYKMVGDILTSEKSIIFTVKEKLPKHQLKEEDILPSSITFPSLEIVNTDVVQGEIKKLSCDPSFYNWQTTPPNNRLTARPMQGGTSISLFHNTYGLNPLPIGTVGCFVIDNDDNSLVGLTNNHMVIRNPFIATDRTLNSLAEDSTRFEILQSAEDLGFSAKVGVTKKYVPFNSKITNYVDAGCFTVLAGNDFNGNSFSDDTISQKQFDLSATGYPFASTAEINGILSTNSLLYSSGRTTGAKGEGITKLRVKAFPSVAMVGYYNQEVFTGVLLSDLITFIATESSSTPVPGTPGDNTGLCLNPIAPGDSGSAVIADFGGIKKIIGLAFAGDGNYTGIACRIDRIASALNISAWSGETLNRSIPSGYDSLIVNDLSSDPYVDVDGKRYWQSGVLLK